MADQQEALERQRELYQEKNEHLERFLEPYNRRNAALPLTPPEYKEMQTKQLLEQ